MDGAPRLISYLPQMPGTRRVDHSHFRGWPLFLGAGWVGRTWVKSLKCVDRRSWEQAVQNGINYRQVESGQKDARRRTWLEAGGMRSDEISARAPWQVEETGGAGGA